MTLFSTIETDLYRYAGDKTIRSFFKHFFRHSPGFKFTVYLRLVKVFGKFHPIGLIGRLLYRKATFKYGYQIPPGVEIGKGFLIMHFGHLVINNAAVIGDNCSIYHGVTIGAVFKGKNKGVPIIGNSVWIGAGSAIVGGIKIGNNVLIAPNAFVNISVPSNSIVLGNPAKIIPKIDATEGYILNSILIKQLDK